jgi:Leucine Rich repeat
MATPASVAPSWLVDHCARLSACDAQLVNLNLNIRRLDNFMITELASAVKHNNVLEVLNLTSSLVLAINAASAGPNNNNGGTDAALHLLVTNSALSEHPSLTILHLSYNRLSNVHCLAEILGTNQALCELYLDHNQIDDNGVHQLGAALQVNSALQVLHLNSNQIGNAGCESLARALYHNRILLVLGLEGNDRISDVTALLMAVKDCNVWIHTIRVPLAPNDELHFYCRANRAGRRFLRHEDLPHDQWPVLLEQINQELDLLHYFVRQKPNLKDRAHSTQDARRLDVEDRDR